MKIEDILALNPDMKVQIMAGLDVGTKETFDVTLVCGDRSRVWRREYLDWLKALNLEVKSISVGGEDACDNKDLLCIFCHPIKVMSEE